MLVMVSTNRSFPLSISSKRYSQATVHVEKDCRTDWDKTKMNHFLVLAGSTSLLVTCLPSICSVLFISAFSFGRWPIGTLAGWSTGEDVKYWSWIIVHAYPSYKNNADRTEHGYMMGMDWL